MKMENKEQLEELINLIKSNAIDDREKLTKLLDESIGAIDVEMVALLSDCLNKADMRLVELAKIKVKEITDTKVQNTEKFNPGDMYDEIGDTYKQ